MLIPEAVVGCSKPGMIGSVERDDQIVFSGSTDWL